MPDMTEARLAVIPHTQLYHDQPCARCASIKDALSSDCGKRLLAYLAALEQAVQAVPRPAEGRCALLDEVELRKKECGR